MEPRESLPLPVLPGEREWRFKTPHGKKLFLEELHRWAIVPLKISSARIEFVECVPQRMGEWYGIYREIRICEHALADVDQAVLTVLHETFHAYQEEMLTAFWDDGKILDQRVVEWAENLDGQYIKSDDGLEGYCKQPYERDAFEFEENTFRFLQASGKGGLAQ